jgi:anti-anti-sigma factor
MYNDFISIKQLDDQNIITFHVSKINILNSNKIEKLLTNIIDNQINNLTLDLINVKFIDSTGFSLLHKIRIKSFINDSNVNYINVSKELEELFNLIGFN